MIDLPTAQPTTSEAPTRLDESAPRKDIAALVVLLAFATLLSLYFVGRLGGRWAENDTASMTEAIRAMLASGSLTAPGGPVYPQGYGYAAVSSFLLAATGLDVATLQQIIYPLVSAFLVLPTWALYRELTGSRRAATIATLLLFVQPEFLFVVLRGSHERMLRTLMVVLLWLLLRSFRYRARPVAYAGHIALFYLAAYALIATNVLFGISFFTAIATVLATGWIFSRLRPRAQVLSANLADRLLSVVLVAAGIGFLFIFTIYPPALSSLAAIGELGKVLASLFLTTKVGLDQYVAIADGWVNLPIYFLVGIGDYLLLAISVVVWTRQALRWLSGDQSPAGNGETSGMLWLLYFAFAIQGVLAIVADRSDFLGANLELREFPSFALIAAPLVAVPVSRWRPRLRGAGLAGVTIALLVALALLKATDEPVLSNKWLFYTVPELQAMAWADRHDVSTAIWTGLDERLRSAYAIARDATTRNNRWDAFSPKPDTHLFIISDVTRWQSARLRESLPEVATEDRVYDDGPVQIYRARPRTPYQR